MALTTHEKIRTEAGFQSQFVRQPFKNSPDGTATSFYVDSDDNVKFVPSFSTGGTIAGISDVQVWLGLSGVYGVSQLGISAIDIDQGSVLLQAAPPTGSSLTISYSSSAITSQQIEDVRLQAESIINQRLSLCYSLPLSPVPSVVSSMATRLAKSLLLMRNYGTGARDTSADGYASYNQLMGANEISTPGSDSERLMVGEIGLICTVNYQLVDDSGSIIPRTDEDAIQGNEDYVPGGRVSGRIYDITEENFRYKDYQSDVDTNQPGSGL